jgi:hypothetical protein
MAADSRRISVGHTERVTGDTAPDPRHRAQRLRLGCSATAPGAAAPMANPGAPRATTLRSRDAVRPGRASAHRSRDPICCGTTAARPRHAAARPIPAAARPRRCAPSGAACRANPAR